ncbi:type II toxin-antitoxin system RelE/ParE family toxin [Novosphingobium sp. FSY-8]|uniref:Type II toxin-antitoxin system RelE/ParE family toxin n=1 Tax=Novosphingobium ovatum TaxID=1908523 RepID=A0ABW9XGR6_9SPHN|nr:type II toxin-antitoxin system RelE/ParE family toxin [Novosphingobium ovatum]NBC37746.1 type II toxin-antitoxin system RelE/ParE family toxin [Novosphingobium ovatum]
MTGWTIEAVSEALAELAAMPIDIAARFERIVRLIEANGLPAMREPYVKHLEGKLWEMRMTGRDGIARAIYFTASGKRVIIARVFAKKTQKTPRSEIETALRRMEAWTDDQG